MSPRGVRRQLAPGRVVSNCPWGQLPLLAAVSLLLIPGRGSAAGIDIHVHAFSENSWSRHVPADEILQRLDEAGIDRAMVLSAGYFQGFWSLVFGRSYDKVRRENDYVAGLVRAHPKRLSGACGVHPFDEWADREIERCAAELGLKALKVHANAQRIDVLDAAQRARLGELARRAGELDMAVLVHAYGRSLDFNRALYRLALQDPGTTFVFLHAFGEHLASLTDEIGRGELGRASNAFIDVSYSVMKLKDPGGFAKALRRFGLERVLFGSDFPVYSPKETLETFRRLPLSPEETKQVLSNELPPGAVATRPGASL